MNIEELESAIKTDLKQVLKKYKATMFVHNNNIWITSMYNSSFEIFDKTDEIYIGKELSHV